MVSQNVSNSVPKQTWSAVTRRSKVENKQPNYIHWLLHIYYVYRTKITPHPPHCLISYYNHY